MIRAAAATAATLVLLAAPGAHGAEPKLSDVVERASRSVVTVQSGGGQGTAFAFGRSGEFLTNAHVVGDSSRVTLVAEDGSSGTAEVVALDGSSDVARLRSSLELEPLAAAREAPRPGDDVFAIGAPDGLDGTVTKGIVSANREVEGEPMIQTDVAVNPGNSGGPLLSAEGLVVGVTSAKASGQEGIAFAIPIERAQEAAGAAPGPSGDESGSSWTLLLIAVALVAAAGFALLLLRRRGVAAPPVIQPRARQAAAPADEPLVLIRRRSSGREPDVVVHSNRSENEWT